MQWDALARSIFRPGCGGGLEEDGDGAGQGLLVAALAEGFGIEEWQVGIWRVSFLEIDLV